MEEIKQIVAKNISELRVTAKMTQLELAEKLNYSDKAVSKWERAESLPDVITLKYMADLFGVTVDYLLNEHPTDEKPAVNRRTKNNHLFISLLSVAAVWLLGTCAYSFGWIFETYLWMAFVVCVPVSAIVLLVFNSIWGRRIWNLYIISLLVWSILMAVFLGVTVYTKYNIWIIFIIGIPAQILISLSFGIKPGHTVTVHSFERKRRVRPERAASREEISPNGGDNE